MSNSGVFFCARIPFIGATAMHSEFSSNLNGELISHVTYLPRMYLLSSNARVLPGETNLLVR
jgi:hypothetical protein